MNAAVPPFPAPRVAPNLSNAFRGVLRLALYRFTSPGPWLWMAGLILLVTVLAATSIHSADRSNFFNWTTDFYVAFFLPVVAFLSGGGAIREEMKGNTVDYILTRPVPRWAYLLFRYAAHWVSAQMGYCLVFVAVAGVGFYRHIPQLGHDLPLFFLAQTLATTVFMALGFFWGAVTGRYVIAGLIYGLVVEVGFGRIPVQLSELSITHQLRVLLRPLSTDSPRLVAAAQTSALLLGISLGLLALAATLFAQREMAGARPSDT